MNTLPPEPSAKDPVSATFIRALIRYIRENTILNGPGYKTKRGPNGTSLVIQKPKSNGQSKAEDNGCFKIAEISSEDKTVKLGNCYFNVGGKTYIGEDTVSPQCEIEDEIAFLCMVISAVSTDKQNYFYLYWYRKTDLTAEQKTASKYIIPLYAFEISKVEDDEDDSAASAGGSEEEKYMFKLVCDMRNAPCAQMWEVFS